MDIKAYIASGILELYVAGALSEKENLEVRAHALKHPEIQSEIEAIEHTVLLLAKRSSPGVSKEGFNGIEERIAAKTIPLERKTPISTYMAWAASVVFAVGLLWMYVENSRLDSAIEVTNKEKETLEERLFDLNEAVAEKEALEQLLNDLRSKDIQVVALGGQVVSPTSFAKAYWNETNQKVYIDAKGLPEPPSGYDYQVWSLTLEPLTPTSIGLLEDFASNDTGIFELENENTSEAFGITLEPEGGSESPNLEQLYTLGTVGP